MVSKVESVKQLLITSTNATSQGGMHEAVKPTTVVSQPAAGSETVILTTDPEGYVP